MKPFFKITAAIVLLGICFITACIKEHDPILPSTTNPIHYSMNWFHSQFGSPIQTYTVNASSGGTFTTPQGTKIIVPANDFMNTSYQLVTGTVTIQFKDIYTKSDMVLNDVAPVGYNYNYYVPFNSGGEFFIKALNGASPLYVVGSPIKIIQPLNGWAMDKNMAAISGAKDSAGRVGWLADSTSNKVIDTTLPGYVFSLYQFSNPVDSGSWCNSDNTNYFSSYTQTSFTIQTTDSVDANNSNVFLLFTGVNSMVHVYYGYSGVGTYPYNYAPQGLSCTIVLLEVTNKGQLKSAFVPTTITTNGTINVTATLTTEANFKTQLATYNH